MKIKQWENNSNVEKILKLLVIMSFEAIGDFYMYLLKSPCV